MNATEKEIRNVRKVRNSIGDDHGDMFVWDLLDIELEISIFEFPETLNVYNVYVRGEQREDLYEQHIQWLAENNLPIPQRRS